MIIHSAMALKICEKMVVGYLKDQKDVNYTPATSTSSHIVNKLTKTVQLTTSAVQKNFRNFYSDLSMIGRHFVVFDASEPQRKR